MIVEATLAAFQMLSVLHGLEVWLFTIVRKTVLAFEKDSAIMSKSRAIDLFSFSFLFFSLCFCFVVEKWYLWQLNSKINIAEVPDNPLGVWVLRTERGFTLRRWIPSKVAECAPWSRRVIVHYCKKNCFSLRERLCYNVKKSGHWPFFFFLFFSLCFCYVCV